MLRRSYCLNSSSNTQEIKLDDFYVSKDLAFISGVTENKGICSSNDNLWIRSPYFPKDLPVKITDSDVVKRNGYVLVTKDLPIFKTSAYTNTYDEHEDFVCEKIELYYVESNGNTYYSKVYGNNKIVFNIDGSEYSGETSSITITAKDKIYIENDTLTVDGITFNATINKTNELTLTDFTGLYYKIPESWSISATCDSAYVQKLQVGNNYKETIKCTNVSYGGYMPYIVYNGETYYLQYFYDENYNITGAGVVIDGNEYACDCIIGLNGYYDNTQFQRESGSSCNIYNINNYNLDSNGNPSMTIDGSKYIINFMPDDNINNSGIICIETVYEHLPILLNDRINIRLINSKSEPVVQYDENKKPYIYFNARKYNVIDHLCDEVIIGREHIPIIYENGITTPKAGTIATAEITNGPMMYFKVVNENNVMKLKKVIPTKDGGFKEVLSMISGVNGTEYSSVSYDIDEHSGVIIDGRRFNVKHHEVSYEYEEDVESSTTVISYDYIEVLSNASYKLKVIGTIWSNKFLCVPDLNPMFFGDKELYVLSAEILDSIQTGDFVVEKNSNAFGVLDLYYDTWAPSAANQSGSTSIYELADIKNNLTLMKKAAYFSIPVGLYEDVTNKIEYQDLITNQYYDDEAEKAINKLVDMEKDMYSPRFITKDGDNEIKNLVSSLVFNLHFRTRDLDTWKIIDDEGLNSENVPLTANYKYCNYFITDYYPYNYYIQENNFDSFGMLAENSDLLGFMYFTTDDVSGKRDKLKKSFLRLTLFDSKNPEKQNMLGTSTLYFDVDRFADVLAINGKRNNLHYELTAKSNQPDRIDGTTDTDRIDANVDISPTVLTECFKVNKNDGGQIETSISDLMIGASDLKLDSRIVVKDRYSSPNNSSEGFDSYILKAFANKKKKQTIYMKAEFFHAGIGIKIPMIIPSKQTIGGYDAICSNDWDENTYDDFKSGYEIKSVFDRLYIPIDIEYSMGEKRFIYSISEDYKYRDAIQKDKNGEKKFVFNLFELKIKSQ